jgi:predicted AlkP superfamily phosphohydrolase/phosphomutase
MERTVLIGLDGATFTVLDPLMDEGVMPFLKSFVAKGVRARLLSTPNPLTPPAWTSLMTGRTPGHHGIFDFARVVRHEGIPRSRMATSRDIRSETIWAIASRSGRSVTTLNFPLMYPPRPVNGSMVPGFVRWRHLRRSLHPTDLYDTLAALPGFDAKELALDWELERKALQALPHGEYEDWIRLHLRRERQWMEILRHLMDTRPADLTAILFDGVDKLQHLCWRFLDPAAEPGAPGTWERTIRDLCLSYFAQLDAFLAEVVERAGPDARVFMASDHGFGPTTEIFYVNVWLHRQGHLQWAEGVGPSAEEKLNVDGHKDPSSLFDWSGTRACALTAGGSCIYIRGAEGPGTPGVVPADYAAFRQRLRDELLALRDPADGRPVVARVLTREEAFPGPQCEEAPDLTLVLRDGGSISVLNSDAVLKRRAETTGAHRPEGIFLASGPGLRAGATLDPPAIADVAATVLYSLGLPLPANLEGRLPTSAFEARFLKARPPREGEPTRTPQAFLSEPEESGAVAREEAQLRRRLRALGYIE